MARKTSHNPDQAPLFSGDHNWNDPTPANPMDGVPIAYGVPGTYVDVEERAKLLITALTSFSERNYRRTFPLATYTPSYSSRIWERYQEVTEPVVIPGARRNAEMYDRLAAQSFWKATGFSALKKTVGVEQIIRPKQIDERAIKMWGDFQDLYARPKDLKARKKYKKLLSGFIRTESARQEETAA